MFVLEEYFIERSMSVHIIQRKIAWRKIKQGGILIKFQNQSSRVFDLIVESVMDYIQSICLFLLEEYLIERSMSVHVVQRKIA